VQGLIRTPEALGSPRRSPKITAGNEKDDTATPARRYCSGPQAFCAYFVCGNITEIEASGCRPGGTRRYQLCSVVLNFGIVAQFVIERELPGAGSLSDAQIREISLRAFHEVEAMGSQIRWLHSYVTEDKVYCVYLALDESIIREHARRAGLPVDRVSAVRRLIDPANLS
jgi:hypothetical protein